MDKIKELREASEFTAEDVPLWLEDKLGENIGSYVALRNDMKAQHEREAKLAGDWVRLAAGYLRTIGENSPPFGGLHHTLIVISDHLYAIPQEKTP